jgi:hypothetical protein
MVALVCGDYDESAVAYIKMASLIVYGPFIRDWRVARELTCRFRPQDFEDL